jgi:hypothetical protein
LWTDFSFLWKWEHRRSQEKPLYFSTHKTSIWKSMHACFLMIDTSLFLVSQVNSVPLNLVLASTLLSLSLQISSVVNIKQK